jgi:hypothetical protein
MTNEQFRAVEKTNSPGHSPPKREANERSHRSNQLSTANRWKKCNRSGKPDNEVSAGIELNLYGFCAGPHACSGQHKLVSKDQIQKWQQIHGKKRPERRNQKQNQRQQDKRKYPNHSHNHRSSGWGDEKDAKRRALSNMQAEIDDLKETNRQANALRGEKDQEEKENAKKAKLRISSLEAELANLTAESRRDKLQCDKLSKEFEKACIEQDLKNKKLHKQQTEFLESIQRDVAALKAVQSRTKCSKDCEEPHCPMDHGGPTNLQLKKAREAKEQAELLEKAELKAAEEKLALKAKAEEERKLARIKKLQAEIEKLQGTEAVVKQQQDKPAPALTTGRNIGNGKHRRFGRERGRR